MLGMTTPIVTELPLRLEAVVPDTFAEPQLQAPPADQAMDRIMNYLECDLRPELTLPQRRRARASASPRRRRLLPGRLAPIHSDAVLAA
jgi:hypothetical protein